MLRKYIKKIERQLNQNFENICERFVDKKLRINLSENRIRHKSYVLRVLSKLKSSNS